MSNHHAVEKTQAELAELFAKDLTTGVGRSVKHDSAAKHVSGEAQYIDDRLEFPNQLHVYARLSDRAHAKIISIDKERLSLSMKQLQEDPWAAQVEQFKKGDEARGTVTRITPFGAFIQLSPAVEALVHITELSQGVEAVDPEKIFKVGEEKTFTILEIDKENRKISLSLKNK